MEGFEPSLCLSWHTKRDSLLRFHPCFSSSAKIQDHISDSLPTIAPSFATALSILSYIPICSPNENQTHIYPLGEDYFIHLNYRTIYILHLCNHGGIQTHNYLSIDSLRRRGQSFNYALHGH